MPAPSCRASVLTGLYAVYVLTSAIVRPKRCRPLPPEARTLRGWRAGRARWLTTLVPPLMLIFLVLGTIFIGLATRPRAAPWARPARSCSPRINGASTSHDPAGARHHGKLSSFVVFILIGARVFSLTFYGVNGHIWVEHLLTAIPGGELGFLIVVNLIVFFLAFFLDFFELAFIVVPLLTPVAESSASTSSGSA